MGLFYIARFTLHEVVRRRLFIVVLVLSIILLIVFALLLNLVTSDMRNSFLRYNSENNDAMLQRQLVSVGVAMSVITGWLSYVLSSILTIVMTIGMISSELEAGTFSIIVPKPVRRAEIVLGKWIGYVIALILYTALIFLAFNLIISWLTGYWPEDWLNALALLELAILALLGITTLGSTFFPTLANGALALILFIGAPIAAFVQYVAQALQPEQRDNFANITTIVSLLIPTDALWRGVSYYLVPNLITAAGGGALDTPFTSASAPTAPFLVWAGVYSLVLPLIAIWRFQKRDL